MGLRKRLHNLHHTEITEDTEMFFKAYSLVMPQKKIFRTSQWGLGIFFVSMKWVFLLDDFFAVDYIDTAGEGRVVCTS